MPITETIFVKEADSKSGVSEKTGKPYTLWWLVDGNDRKFKTFKAGIGEPSKNFAGGYAEVDYEEKRDGSYVDFQLLAARPSSSDETQAPFQDQPSGNGGPASVDRERELDRIDCLKAAFSYGAFAFAKCEPDERHLLERYCFGLATRMEAWYSQQNGPDTDDVPFS